MLACESVANATPYFVASPPILPKALFTNPKRTVEPDVRSKPRAIPFPLTAPEYTYFSGRLNEQFRSTVGV